MLRVLVFRAKLSGALRPAPVIVRGRVIVIFLALPLPSPVLLRLGLGLGVLLARLLAVSLRRRLGARVARVARVASVSPAGAFGPRLAVASHREHIEEHLAI